MISAHAIMFARAQISAPAIASYWVHLLRDYAALQRFSVAAGAGGNSSVAGRSLCTCYSTLLPAELAGAISSSSATSTQLGASKGMPRATVPAELCPALLCRWVPGSVASPVTALPARRSRSRSGSGSSRAPTKKKKGRNHPGLGWFFSFKCVAIVASHTVRESGHGCERRGGSRPTSSLVLAKHGDRSRRGGLDRIEAVSNHHDRRPQRTLTLADKHAQTVTLRVPVSLRVPEWTSPRRTFKLGPSLA